jgi:hypothetical protein
MAIAEFATGSQAITVSDTWSLTTDTSGPDLTGTDGVYQIFIDVSDMVTGDQVYFYIVEDTGGGNSYITYQAWLYGPQPTPVWVSPTFVMTTNWDAIAGTLAGTVTIDWSIRAIT